MVNYLDKMRKITCLNFSKTISVVLPQLIKMFALETYSIKEYDGHKGDQDRIQNRVL